MHTVGVIAPSLHREYTGLSNTVGSVVFQLLSNRCRYYGVYRFEGCCKTSPFCLLLKLNNRFAIRFDNTVLKLSCNVHIYFSKSSISTLSTQCFCLYYCLLGSESVKLICNYEATCDTYTQYFQQYCHYELTNLLKLMQTDGNKISWRIPCAQHPTCCKCSPIKVCVQDIIPEHLLICVAKG